MNTFPHPQPLVWCFAENFRHDVETAEIGGFLLPGADFLWWGGSPAILIGPNGLLALAKTVGKLLLGHALVKAVLSEIVWEHVHTPNRRANVLTMSSVGVSKRG